MNPVINRRPIYVSISSIIVIMLTAAVGALAIIPRENTISPGVYVNGQYVGGLTGPQAEDMLKKRFGEGSATEYIKLQNDRQKWVISYDDIGVAYDFSATVKEALKTGKTGSVIQDAVEVVRIYFAKPDIALHYEIDHNKLDRILVGIGSEINITAQNASICMFYGRIKVLPAVTGRTLNINSARQKIERALGRHDSNPIILDLETHLPELTSDSLKQINGSVGLGMSAVSPSKGLRFAALKSAVEMLNGVLIKPGKEFSFNMAVGRTLEELIYRYGTVVQRNGKSVLANSGGTSQVASTLYQAVMSAGLKVNQRFAHIVPPAGIMRGQDAAVVLGKLDFKFENNTKHPVYIMAEIKDDKVIVNLMGVREDGLNQ